MTSALSMNEEACFSRIHHTQPEPSQKCRALLRMEAPDIVANGNPDLQNVDLLETASRMEGRF